MKMLGVAPDDLGAPEGGACEGGAMAAAEALRPGGVLVSLFNHGACSAEPGGGGERARALQPPQPLAQTPG
jgi:hypothetical protein